MALVVAIPVFAQSITSFPPASFPSSNVLSLCSSIAFARAFLPDSEVAIASYKARYELPLKEIFE
jgi:hypothetical protein